MKFDRFRAYASTEGGRSKMIKNEDGSIPRDEDGEVVKTRVASWPVEEVAFEGEADADGKATFNAGDTTITKVAFYAGPADGERVVGSLDVGKPGKISVPCPDKA